MAEPSWKPGAILARGTGWGCISGTSSGMLLVAVPAICARDLFGLAVSVFGALIGAIVGAVLGLISAALLLIPGHRWPRDHPDCARLLAGGVAAAPAILLLLRSLPVGAGPLQVTLAFSAVCFVIGAVLAHRVLWGVWRLPAELSRRPAGRRLAR